MSGVFQARGYAGRVEALRRQQVTDALLTVETPGGSTRKLNYSIDPGDCWTGDEAKIAENLRKSLMDSIPDESAREAAVAEIMTRYLGTGSVVARTSGPGIMSGTAVTDRSLAHLSRDASVAMSAIARIQARNERLYPRRRR